MTTYFKRSLAALALLAGMVSSLPAAQAAVSADPNTSVSASAIAAMPGYDTDRVDDDIIQLSNLKVTNISYVASIQGGPDGFAPGGLYAVITASPDYGVSCQKFSSETSARSMPCATSLSRPYPYQIHVTGRTLLLGANRSTLSMDQVAVGDRINVYGYFDRDGMFVDALIVRDLDKPQAPKTVQLENLRVFSVGKDGRGGLEVLAGSTNSTCYHWSANVKRPWTCPLGVSAAAAAESNTGAAAAIDLYRPSVVYRISVPASAQIIASNRAPLGRVIREGDTINVYGTMKDTQTVTAQVVRVMKSAPVEQKLSVVGGGTVSLTRGTFASIPFSASGGTAPYRWDIGKPSVFVKAVGLPQGMYLTTAYPVNCQIDTPCPQPMPDPNQAQAWIAGTPTMPGTYAVSLNLWDAVNRVTSTEVRITVSRL